MAKSKKKIIREAKEAEIVEPEVVNERHDDGDDDQDRSVLTRVVVAILLLIGLFLIINFISNRGDDDADKSANDETSQTEDADEAGEDTDSDAATETGQISGTSVEETDKEYKYVVGGGESYTTLARRAVASVDKELTPAERVAAETKLVSEANAQWLNEGQSLVLSKETVTAAVSWAKSLTADQKAAWQPYADLVAW